jgi:hypothetical protein
MHHVLRGIYYNIKPKKAWKKPIVECFHLGVDRCSKNVMD